LREGFAAQVIQPRGFTMALDWPRSPANRRAAAVSSAAGPPSATVFTIPRAATEAGLQSDSLHRTQQVPNRGNSLRPRQNLPHTSVYEPGGREFESLQARHFPLEINYSRGRLRAL
jgi:hypothetical protein